MQEEYFPYNSITGNARSSWKTCSPKLSFALYQDNGYGHQTEVSRGFTATNNLLLGGSAGIINKHYKAYFDFRMSTKCLKIIKQMSFLEIKALDFSRKHMIGGNKYLLGEVQVTMTRGKINPATIKAYLCV